MARGLWLALAVTVLLRLPAFGYGVISDDEAIYDAMGAVVAGGGVMYRDTVDHKPPGLTYTYATARRIAGEGDGAGARSMALVHLFGLLAVCATSLVLFAVGRRLFDERAGVWAAALYGIASAAKQPADGLAVNGELLMNLPVALAVLAVLAARRQRGVRALLLDVAAGALCGVAALYKYQAALVGLALPLLLLAGPRPVSLRDRLRVFVFPFVSGGACWLAGLCLPFALAALYFDHRGALDDALFWGLRFNREYLAQGPGLMWSLQRLALQLGAVVAPSILLYAAAAVALVRSTRRVLASTADARPGGEVDSRSAEGLFLFTWGLLSLAAVGLGGRFFGHYFLQAELPLSLAAAPIVAGLFDRAPRRITALLLAPALAFGAIAAQPALCRRLFHGDDPDYDAIGRAAAAQLRPDDTLWVWGNVPQIYHSADRRQGARFSFCNYLTGLSPATPSEYDHQVDPRRDRVERALPMALADLESHRPPLVIDTAEHDLKHYGRFPISDFAPLADYLARHYRRGETVAGAVFYHRSLP